MQNRSHEHVRQIGNLWQNTALADLGGCARHTPLQDPILSFLHTFSQKSARIRGPRPPNGSTPPYSRSLIRHCTVMVPATSSVEYTYQLNIKMSRYQNYLSNITYYVASISWKYQEKICPEGEEGFLQEVYCKIFPFHVYSSSY